MLETLPPEAGEEQPDRVSAVPICYGDFDHLVGIDQPARPNAPDLATTVVMLTPGMLHHVGPMDLHVRLADSLSEHGIASFRFDLSGIGESLGIGSASADSLDRARDEISQTIDWLDRKRPGDRIILFGLCSGADDAFHAAQTDPRVNGIICVDGLGYPTKGFRYHRWRSHYLPRIFSGRKWLRFASSVLGGKLSAKAPQSLTGGEDIREFPGLESARPRLRELAERGVGMEFIYTGGVAEYYNHAGQFRKMFPFVEQFPHVRSHYFPRMDHVATLREDRQKLIQHVVETACRFRFGRAKSMLP